VQWGTSRALDLTGRCNSLSGGRGEGRSLSRPEHVAGPSGPLAVRHNSNESVSDSQTSPNSQSQSSHNQGGRRTRFTLEGDAQVTRSTEDVELFLGQPDVSPSGTAVARVTPVQSSIPEDVEMGGAAGMGSAVRAAQCVAYVSSPDSQQPGSHHGVRSPAVEEPSQLTTQSSQLSSQSDDSSDEADLPGYTHTPPVRVSETSGEL